MIVGGRKGSSDNISLRKIAVAVVDVAVVVPPLPDNCPHCCCCCYDKSTVFRRILAFAVVVVVVVVLPFAVAGGSILHWTNKKKNGVRRIGRMDVLLRWQWQPPPRRIPLGHGNKWLDIGMYNEHWALDKVVIQHDDDDETDHRRRNRDNCQSRPSIKVLAGVVLMVMVMVVAAGY